MPWQLHYLPRKRRHLSCTCVSLLERTFGGVFVSFSSSPVGVNGVLISSLCSSRVSLLYMQKSAERPRLMHDFTSTTPSYMSLRGWPIILNTSLACYSASL